ncbi:hypothetical protein [Sphingobacterium multivorum]|uniref:hypothetical protein n=1 Tax=Sphingobacterium multivorum TaxID=28454 RepID=UPI00289E1CF3|nr:hypothetical protein [Sphingobacterium multivorum]
MDKRYLLFVYDKYYPSGGLFDLKESFDTLEEARDAAMKSECDYKEVYDRIAGVEIVLNVLKIKPL